MSTPLRITRVSVSALSIPLIEPFVIATGRIDCTRAALVQVTLEDDGHNVFHGLGEAAALPPVTQEDQPDLLESLQACAAELSGALLSQLDDIAPLLDGKPALQGKPVARAGLECALLDALAKHVRKPLCTLLTGLPPTTLTTDMTLPIGAPRHMAQLAQAHKARGFTLFKVKVGKRFEDDVQALRLVRAQVPEARFRLDANEGYSAEQAIAMLDAAERFSLPIDCFEQPCARDDVDGMAAVTADGRAPVIADESVKTIAELEALHEKKGCHGVNLKLVKSGGPLACLAIGQRAREFGLSVMTGGMVESRLGMTAMAHVASALGGVDYVDLDTAFLLAEDPFEGGYTSAGAELTVSGEPGLGLRLR